MQSNLTACRHLSAAKRILSAVLSLSLAVLAPLLLASCESGSDEPETVNYGSYGMQQAFSLANANRFRHPYSQGEFAAGEMIIEELEALGYEPAVQQVTVNREDGSSVSTRNISVFIDGEGFVSEEELKTRESRPARTTAGSGVTTGEEPLAVHNKQVIVGTHYDTPTTPEDETMANYTGLSDNASGMASLLTLARELRGAELAYDVHLVFFGAGNDDHAGARAWLASMSDEEIAATDVMYALENLYAGDKLYGHAGLNSLEPGRKYELRRKLYEATDVVFEHNLPGLMNVNLVTNQGGYMVSVPGLDAPQVFREFTLKTGDHTPFDQAGVPVVFFESAEYDVGSLEEVTESEHPAFEATGGLVSGTDFDNTYTLRTSLGTELLLNRINATAFILAEAIQKGSFGYVPVSDSGDIIETTTQLS